MGWREIEEKERDWNGVQNRKKKTTRRKTENTEKKRKVAQSQNKEDQVAMSVSMYVVLLVKVRSCIIKINDLLFMRINHP